MMQRFLNHRITSVLLPAMIGLGGTTYYTHSISPEFYWGMVSDEIIHQIHLRVLNHIKSHTEKR